MTENKPNEFVTDLVAAFHNECAMSAQCALVQFSTAFKGRVTAMMELYGDDERTAKALDTILDGLMKTDDPVKVRDLVSVLAVEAGDAAFKNESSSQSIHTALRNLEFNLADLWAHYMLNDETTIWAGRHEEAYMARSSTSLQIRERAQRVSATFMIRPLSSDPQ